MSTAPEPITTAENTGRNSGQFQRGNVFRFPSGRSANPGGRPKAIASEKMRMDFERKLPKQAADLRALAVRLYLNPNTCTFGDLAIRSLMIRAIKETASLQEVVDRIEGKALARTELSGVDGKDIQISVTYVDGEHKD